MIKVGTQIRHMAIKAGTQFKFDNEKAEVNLSITVEKRHRRRIGMVTPAVKSF